MRMVVHGGRPEYYGRDGKPITREQAYVLMETIGARRVAETTLPDGKWVSTVHLVHNHGFGDGPPIIFETMVFSSREDMNELDVDRYATESDARAGHDAMVAQWTTSMT